MDILPLVLAASEMGDLDLGLPEHRTAPPRKPVTSMSWDEEDEDEDNDDD